MKINELKVGDKVFVVRRAKVNRIWIDGMNEPLIRLISPGVSEDDFPSMFFARIGDLVFDHDDDLDDENSLDKHSLTG